MRQYKDRSPSNIEREVAAHRADIADTVAEMKQRLSPGELLDGSYGTAVLARLYRGSGPQSAGIHCPPC
jgi:hypothetical protein